MVGCMWMWIVSEESAGDDVFFLKIEMERVKECFISIERMEVCRRNGRMEESQDLFVHAKEVRKVAVGNWGENCLSSGFTTTLMQRTTGFLLLNDSALDVAYGDTKIGFC
jgi:hypothetical protein